MKFLTLHTGISSNRQKIIFNPFSMAYAKQRMEDGFNSLVFVGGTAFPVTETIDEIEKMANESFKEEAK